MTKRVSGSEEGKRPRSVFIAAGFALVVIGALLVFLNYSTTPGLAYFGVVVGLAGVGLAFFGPSRKKGPRPNGNHGSA